MLDISTHYIISLEPIRLHADYILWCKMNGTVCTILVNQGDERSKPHLTLSHRRSTTMGLNLGPPYSAAVRSATAAGPAGALAALTKTVCSTLSVLPSSERGSGGVLLTGSMS